MPKRWWIVSIKGKYLVPFVNLEEVKMTTIPCSGCGKPIKRPAPALPYSYCRICRGR